MAHRLLLRRICTVGVKDVRGLSASTTRAASSCFSTSVQSAAPRVSFLSASRTLPGGLPHTSRREVSFNVQDQEDFTERVIKSQLPVLIDFHAQWVLGKVTMWLVGILHWATVRSNQGGGSLHFSRFVVFKVGDTVLLFQCWPKGKLFYSYWPVYLNGCKCSHGYVYIYI